jgi:DNA-binding transcriptional ArsR family regulator
VVAGSSRVRQAGPPSREGVARIGKSRAAILHTLVECGGEMSRHDLAARLGRKAASMRAPLRWLVEAGLLVRVRRGHYALPADYARRWEDARELGGEPEADRMQIARHDRERDAYRRRNEARPDRALTEREMRQAREGLPWQRRICIERAIARLFAARPEYRARRVGQITCALIDHLGPDFPRGQIGVPKDAEVEAILDGFAA